MPLLSAFTPCGLLAMSSAPSLAESIYNSMANGIAKSGLDCSPGSREDCTIYAQAMGIARARLCMEKGFNQQLPLKTTDMLDEKEEEYQLIPGPNDTMPTRRAALAVARELPAGAGFGNVENALRTLLGDDFVALRPTKNSEAVPWPTLATDQPINFQLPSVPHKVLTLLEPVTSLGSPFEVAFAPANNADDSFLIGDKVLIDAGNDAQSEVVTITSLRRFFLLRLTATFTKSHDVGAVGTTQPWPMWTSTKRYTHIVVTPSAAVDPEKRRKINELMDRMLRGVSCWGIAAESSPGHIGPFFVGVSVIGTCPVIDIAFP